MKAVKNNILQILTILTCLCYIVRVCIIKGNYQFIGFPITIIALMVVIILINQKLSSQPPKDHTER